VRLAVTTSLHPSREELAAASAAAERHALPFALRGRASLAEVAAAGGVEGLLVLTRVHAGLWADGEERRWAPGMGSLRVKRALARLAGRPLAPTDRDPFLDAAGIAPGDVVLDATLGLGADALVAAAAAGPGGRVIGLEASPALAAWVDEGLRRLDLEPARRVEVRAAEHGAALRELPARSVDVVIFDPMFRHARAGPGGFDLVRRLAEPRPLAPEVLESARRVARRWVVVKDGAPGWDLTRLGLTPMPSARGAHRYYARVPAAG